MRFALSLLLLASGLAHAATSGVLIEKLPSRATSEVVLEVVRQAFLGRRWDVVESDPSSVTAKFVEQNGTVTLRVQLSERSLIYSGSARPIQRGRSPAQNTQAGGRTQVPERWVHYLRSDIAIALATIPDR
jgi:hypothetical protein